MPAVIQSRFLKLGRRASLLITLLPWLSQAQIVAAHQVVSLGVAELSSILLVPPEDGLRASSSREANQNSAGLVWTTNGARKKITVDAIPPVAGLRMIIEGELLQLPAVADLGHSHNHHVFLPIDKSAGSGFVRYIYSEHLHTAATSCTVRLTVTNF